MLRAENIAVSIRGKRILSDVSIAIKPGIFTTVVGANGAGKSTLLKALTHELRCSSGRITINGNTIDSYKPRALSMVRAVLPQHSEVQFTFTVEQIVQLGRHAHIATRAEHEAVVAEVMELTDITRFRKRAYHTLSGGEKQRVQLARVLGQVWEQTVYPRYVLLDEPTASLDIAQQHVIFSLARTACARNIGVMAIIHDLNQAVQFADEMFFLRNGQMVAQGRPDEVFTKQNIEETFSCRVSLYHLSGHEHPITVPDHTAMCGHESLLASNEFNKK